MPDNGNGRRTPPTELERARATIRQLEAQLAHERNRANQAEALLEKARA